METLKDFVRGIRASFGSSALVAVGWAYAAVLAVGLAFTLVAFRFVAASVDHSAMAAELRAGQTAAWAIDVLGRDGTWAAVSAIAAVAVVLVPIYLVLVIFFSGGILAKVRASLGLAGPERFVTASARHAGAMARVASLEIVVVGILGAIVLFGVSAAAVADVGHWVAWLTLAVALAALAIVTAVFDYARIGVVANDDGSAARALGDAFGFVTRQGLSVVVLALLNLVVAVVALWAAAWIHSLVALDTGGGVALGIVVGQVGLFARLWSRVAAYASETSLWSRVSA